MEKAEFEAESKQAKAEMQKADGFEGGQGRAVSNNKLILTAWLNVLSASARSFNNGKNGWHICIPNRHKRSPSI
jgi:hypothetical protein